MGPRTAFAFFALLPTLYISCRDERRRSRTAAGRFSSQNDPLRVLLSLDESESDSMTRTVSVVWV